MRRVAVLAALTVLAADLIFPAAAQAEGSISALSVFPSSVRDGASAVGTVTLIPDAGPTTVNLYSSDPSVASVPASVVAPGGQGTVDFTITTSAAAPPTIVQITAWIANTPRTANLSVNAATPPGPSLSSVSVTPSNLTGGSPATGTVTFTGIPGRAALPHHRFGRHGRLVQRPLIAIPDVPGVSEPYDRLTTSTR